PRRSFSLRPNIFGNQKKSPSSTAKVAATPITRWKWPVTKSLVIAASASSARERKIPVIPPERNSETKPSANSMDVVSCGLAFQRVPSQLAIRNAAGIPSEDASKEKTSGELGFSPRENMWKPQTQKPKRPTPQNARTAMRSFHTGLREKTESR